jgi:hypothetical protein
MSDDEQFKHGRPIDPGELPYVSTWRPRLYWAVVAAIVSPIVIDGLTAAVARYSRDLGVVAGLFFTCIEVTKFCLLATWLAWGGSRAVVRIIVVFISLLISSAMFGARSNEITQIWAMLFLGTISLASAIALPKLFGVRWIAGEEMLSDGRVHERAEYRSLRQFTLVDMFVWTLTVAVVDGMFRWLGLPDDISHENPVDLLVRLLPGIAAPAIGTILCLWAAMSRDPRVGLRTMISLGSMYLLTSPIWLMALLASRGPESAIAIFCILASITATMLLVIGCLLVPRNLGDRMVRFRNGKPIERPYQLDVTPPFGRPMSN